MDRKFNFELTSQASASDIPANRLLTCSTDVAAILGLNVIPNATLVEGYFVEGPPVLVPNVVVPGEFISIPGPPIFIPPVIGKETQPITPTFNAVDGKFGTYQWTFPRPVQLGGIYPYLFIQSRELGTDIKVANGAMGFWRMVLNDQVNYSLSMVNNRVDTYTDVPRKLQNIDIKLVYPDGTDVNNNGGRFTLLLEIVRLV